MYLQAVQRVYVTKQDSQPKLHTLCRQVKLSKTLKHDSLVDSSRIEAFVLCTLLLLLHKVGHYHKL